MAGTMIKRGHGRRHMHKAKTRRSKRVGRVGVRKAKGSRY
jgi:hypothetical protein